MFLIFVFLVFQILFLLSFLRNIIYSQYGLMFLLYHMAITVQS